ncbi:MAG: DUF456 domain-containing protein [Candidatus Omnitrophica bacterium]|nr:DUF456 domain-containing protein [Candidatus Omnitrophota bacterium]
MTPLIITISIFCLIGGFFGSILPALPGPPLSYAALVILQFAMPTPPFSLTLLVILGVITVLLLSLDYILPLIGARVYGATKYGIIGALIGMFIGLICFPPFGMIFGILFGAICGELLIGRHYWEALRSGLASFVVSISLIFIKFLYCLVLTYFFVKALLENMQ